MKEEMIKKFIDKGVHFIDPSCTYIDDTVEIEEGTIIYPNVSLRGKTFIGKNNKIDMNTIIQDAQIGRDNIIIQSVIIGSEIGNQNEIGPFTNIRTNTYIGNHNQLGSFVELKNAVIKDYNNIKHLAYCGDVTIKNNVNIGAGTVIANYNPKTKLKQNSLLDDLTCIGANSVIVSPITIGKNSQVAAGSVITENVVESSLAIARCRQITKEDYYREDNV